MDMMPCQIGKQFVDTDKASIVQGFASNNQNSSDYEQKSHWNDMINAKNKEIKQWHTLLEDDNM